MIKICFVIGDSGGPLMIYSAASQRYELVAIASLRNTCDNEGLFTRTASFIDWIWTILANPPTPGSIFPTFTFVTVTVPTPKPDVLGKFQKDTFCNDTLFYLLKVLQFHFNVIQIVPVVVHQRPLSFMMNHHFHLNAIVLKEELLVERMLNHTVGHGLSHCKYQACTLVVALF